jgi:hypothetical protein
MRMPLVKLTLKWLRKKSARTSSATRSLNTARTATACFSSRAGWRCSSRAERCSSRGALRSSGMPRVKATQSLTPRSTVSKSARRDSSRGSCASLAWSWSSIQASTPVSIMRSMSPGRGPKPRRLSTWAARSLSVRAGASWAEVVGRGGFLSR